VSVATLFEWLGSTSSPRKAARWRLLVLMAASCLVFFWTVLPSGEAAATTDYVDLLGENAYQTSVLVSKAGYAPGVDGVVVANGDDYMAATCSAVLAAAYGGPVLLTPAASLDAGVRDEIWRLSPDHVFVVGTEAAVAQSIATAFPELAAEGGVVSLCGADGSQTARLVAEQVKGKVGTTGGVVLVAGDRNVAPASCAVSASALASAKSWPLLFVPDSGALPDDIATVVTGLGPSTIVEVQTTVDVGSKATVVRVEGKNQFEVGKRIGEYASSIGLSYAHTLVVADAEEMGAQGQSVGAYLARNQGIVVVCGRDGIPIETVQQLIGQGGAINRVDFCGPSQGARERLRLLVDTPGLPMGFGTTTLKLKTGGAEVAWVEQRLTDLSYRPGPVDGVYDKRTKQGVIGFEKWEGLKRDGVVQGDEWWRLLSATRPVPRFAETGKWIEINKKKQVLLYCVNGVVVRTIAVSTGSPSVGIGTPSGEFHIMRENTYERVLRYKPLYLRNTTALAIHGFRSVPPYPASHGCIRMIRADMDEFHYLIPLGTLVHIY
jgi:N-acetylmuramoyl-L-alanine amidase